MLDAHGHADHVTGAWLRQYHNGARIGISIDISAESADD